MKKLFPLLFLVILFVSIRVVYAETESLYVDSKTTDMQNWDERNAPSPYLADESTGYVHEVKSSAATEGYFGFADPSGTGTITSVYLYIECYGDDTNDQVNIYLNCDDGSDFLLVGGITINQLTYDWESLYLGRLDSWYDIQSAQIYLYYLGVGGGDDVFVRRAYLYVDYTPAGAEYTRDLSQGLTVASDSSRTWTLTRSLTQTMTTATLNSRTWSTSRATTQGISVGFDSYRTWSLSRALTQGITLSSSAVYDIFKGFTRSITLGLSLTIDSLRNWDLTRSLSQGMSLTSDSLRGWTLSRTLTQSMSFLSSTFAKLTAWGGTEFLRNIAMGLSLTTDSMRTWGLSRTLDQGLSFSSNAFGQKLLGELIKRFVSLNITLSPIIAVTLRILNEMNIEMVGLIGLTLLIQASFMYLIYREKKPLHQATLGIIATLCWFAMGHISLSMNPTEGFAIAYVYDAIGILDTLFSFKAAIDFMQQSQDADDFWS